MIVQRLVEQFSGGGRDRPTCPRTPVRHRGSTAPELVRANRLPRRRSRHHRCLCQPPSPQAPPLSRLLSWRLELPWLRLALRRFSNLSVLVRQICLRRTLQPDDQLRVRRLNRESLRSQPPPCRDGKPREPIFLLGRNRPLAAGRSRAVRSRPRSPQDRAPRGLQHLATCGECKSRARAGTRVSSSCLFRWPRR